MINIPSRESKRLVQTNRSDLLGDLWSSWNLDLQSNLGAIRVSKKLRLNASTADDADFGLPCAFAHFDGRFWTIAGTRVFKNTANTIINALSTEDSSSGSATDYDPDQSDLAVFDSRLWATTDDALLSKVSDSSGTGAWTSRDILGSGTVHRMNYFKKHDRLYYTDNNVEVKSINAGNTAADPGSDYAIDIGDTSGSIQCMTSNSSSIFLGTIRNVTSSSADSTQGASILEWDGINSTPSREFKIDAQGVLAMCVRNDVVYALDSNGVLLKFTGYSFVEESRLPLDRELLLNAIAASGWFIHPNGLIATKEGTVLALINGALANYDATNRPLKENLPSGIWEWSENNGFVHRHSFTYTPVTVSGTEATDITDFGQIRLEGVGALANAPLYSTSSSGRSSIVCGAQYFTDATTTTYGCFVDSPIPTNIAATSEGKKFGYFVTTWVQSRNAKEEWQRIYVKFKQLLNSSDKIIAKYRTTESVATEISIEWTSATTFQTSTNVSAYIGYEVEVLNGKGAGKCAHITDVTGSSTYTVTLDESFIGATSGTAKARIQNWTKISSYSAQSDEVVDFTFDAKASPRIQFKIAMQFTGDDELHEVVIINQQNEPLK